jgi:hypothetical protein
VAGRKITANGRTARWPFGRPFHPTAIRPFGQYYGHSATFELKLALKRAIFGDLAGRMVRISAIRPVLRPDGQTARRPSGHPANGRWPSFFLWYGRMAGRLDFSIRPPALQKMVKKSGKREKEIDSKTQNHESSHL